MREAEIDHAADDERRKVFVGEQRRRQDLNQDIENVENVRVAHQGQVNEILDLPASNLGPDTIVFAPYFVAGRMRRPIRAAALQEIKAYLDPAIAAIQSRVNPEP